MKFDALNPTRAQLGLEKRPCVPTLLVRPITVSPFVLLKSINFTADISPIMKFLDIYLICPAHKIILPGKGPVLCKNLGIVLHY